MLNGGFESGLTSWKISSGTAVSQTTNVLCGSYSAKLGGSSRNGLEQTVTGLSPNTTYTLQAQCKVSTSGVTGSVGIKNFGGTTITRSFTSTTYTAQSITFTTGATNTSATLYGYNSTGNYIYLDAVYLATGTGSLLATVARNPSRDLSSENNIKEKFSISPNPAQNLATIHYTSDREETAKIILYNATSKKLQESERMMQSGVNKIDLNLAAVKSGLYFVTVISSAGERTTKKLIISK